MTARRLGFRRQILECAQVSMEVAVSILLPAYLMVCK